MPDNEEQINRDDGNQQVNQQEQTTDTNAPVGVNQQQQQQQQQGAGANTGGGYNLNFGALSIQSNTGLTSISGSLSLAGIVTPLGGQLQGQLTPEGYTITYSGGLPLQGGIAGVNFQGLTLNRITVNQNGLQALDISAGSITIGNNLLTLSNIQASLTGENPNFTINAATGVATLMGQTINLTNPAIEIGRDGVLRSISVGAVNVGNFTAQGIRWDGTNLTITSAGIPLPEIFGQQISAEFQNITINPTDGTYAATGIFNNATTLKFMNDSLQLSAMTGTVQLQNNNWNVDVTGNISYNQPNVDFTGQGHLTLANNAAPTFGLQGGEMHANLSGVNFTSSGIEYDSTEQVIKILSGQATVPAFNTQLMASVGNAKLSATGFDFETMSFNMSEGVEMFPGLHVHVPLAQLQKDGGNYKFVLQNGNITFVQSGVEGTGTVNVEYSQSTGVQGSISGLHIGTNFMDVDGTGAITFDQQGIRLEGATFKVKNLGPESQNLQVTAQNAVYNSTGLNIGSLDVALPRLGELNLRGHFDNIHIGGGFSGSGVIQNEGDMNFGNGALKIEALAGTVSVAEGGWNISVNGNLVSNVENVQAAGQVNIAYNASTGLALTVTSGNLSMNMAGISITSTGITYSSENFELGVTQTQVNLPEFQGSELTATIQGVTFNREGFNFTNLTIQSSGAMELMPGLTVSGLTGQLQREDGKYAVILDGAVQLSGALQGGADSVHLEYRESGSTVVVRNFRAETAIFSVSAGEVAYQNQALSIDAASLRVKNLGPGSESLQLSATGIVYNSEGLNVQTLDVTLPRIGDVNIQAHLQGLRATREGLSLQSGTVQANGNLSFLQGALTVNALQGNVQINNEGWNLDIAGDLGVTTPNVQASGRVKILYSRDAGPQLQIENGSLNTQLAGLRITATGIQYNSENEAALQLTQTNIVLPEFANSQLTATVTNARYGPQGFDFDSVTIQSSGEMQLLPGLYVQGLTGQVIKEGENYAVILDGGVAFRGTALQGGADGVHLEYRNGASSFEVRNLRAHTELFEMTVSRGTYSNGTLGMDTATFKAKGLGPGSDSLTVETSGVRYNSEGLFVNTLDVSLPRVGDVDIRAHVQGLSVTSAGVAIESGSINATGNISFANGALTVSSLNGTVGLSSDGRWNISISGGLATQLPNVTAEGNLTLSYDSQLGPQLNIQGGRVIGTYAGVVLTAEGLSYNTQDFTLNVTTARVDIPQLSGGELQTTVQGVRFGPQGFEIEGVAIRSTGTINLFPGFQLANLQGSFSRSGDSYAVSMGGSVNVNAPFLRGGAEGVNFRYENEQASFSFTNLHIENDLFDFNVANASYANGTVSIGQADLNLRNVGPLNGTQSRATGIQYNEQGLTLASLHAQFPKIGDTSIFADFSNLNVPASGGVTGSATIGVNPSEIALAGGKVKVQNISGTASIANDSWGVAISAGLGVDLGRDNTASGDVTISYDRQTGPNLTIQNGQFNGSMYGIRVAGSGMSFNMQQQELRMDSASLTLMNLGSGINTTVNGIVINRQGMRFNNLAVNINQTYNLFPGLAVTLKNGTINNSSTGTELGVGIGVALSNSSLGLRGTADGRAAYNMSNGQFTGSLTGLSISTSVFNFSVPNGVQITQNGLSIPTARLQFAENFDAEKLKQMIPAAARIPAPVLQALKSIAIDATGITYNSRDGLKVTDWNLSVLKIPISIPSIGVTGEINPVDGTGFLRGTKRLDLAEMGVPTRVSMEIPIVGPVTASARLGVEANANISADISVSRNGENFVLAGGMGFSGYAGIYAEILAGVNVGIASARIGAGARFGINFSGRAGMESEMQYNPTAPNIADKISPVGPIKFGYFFDANLISSIYLVLETEVLWGLWGSRNTWDLAEWTLGSLLVSGASSGNSFGELLSGLRNHVAFIDKKGDGYNLAGGLVELPASVERERRTSNANKISEMRRVADRESPDD